MRINFRESAAVFRVIAILICAALAQPAAAQIFISSSGPTPLHRFMDPLNALLETNGPIAVVFQPCGIENAFWDNAGRITICEELVRKALDRRSQALSQGQVSREVADLIADGEVLFVALHELGHAVIDRHRIAFSGKEEDVADQFAAWLIMRLDNAPMYVGAMNFFAEPARLLHIFGKRQLTDEHGLNPQRRAQLVCWGYGRAPAAMQSFADHVGLSASRRPRCAEEFQQLMRNTPEVFRAALKSPQSAAGSGYGYGQPSGYPPPAPRPGGYYGGIPPIPPLPAIPPLPPLPEFPQMRRY